jgi:hypothetical protein
VLVQASIFFETLEGDRVDQRSSSSLRRERIEEMELTISDIETPCNILKMRRGVKINIRGVDRYKLLNALWEQQTPALFFFMNGVKPPQWNEQVAKEHLKDGYIDYCLGRCIKTDLSKDIVDTRQYDRDGPPFFTDALKKIKHD